MSTLNIYFDGVGLWGPGLSGWENSCDVLTGRAPYGTAPTLLPAVEKLPPAERRRVGMPVKLSMAIGLEAARHAGADLTNLSTVFSSTEADCDNTHAILETLASNDRALSPTRFHNSVHNAASGYWGIATGSMQPSTSLSAYDATFAAGLLEATTQALSSGKPCLLLAYDTGFPEPLQRLRPIPAAMGVALVVNPHQTLAARALLKLTLSDAPATPMRQDGMEQLRQSIPAARSLPLLALLAHARSGAVVLEYLDSLRLGIEVCSIT
ncbi:MAG: beta-ketoacyl synthase chain length factor [Giesbergeria sp.]